MEMCVTVKKCPKLFGLFTRHSWVEESLRGFFVVNERFLHGIVEYVRVCSVCGERQVCVDDCGGACGKRWIKAPIQFQYNWEPLLAKISNNRQEMNKK